MDYLDKKKFSFLSNAPGLSDDTFTVVRFKGFEAVSVPYEFDISLVTRQSDVNSLDVLANTARFVFELKDGDPVVYSGILAEFEEVREVNGFIFYRALLVPKLWWLKLTHHNQVFLDTGVDTLVEKTLQDCDLMVNYDFEFRLGGSYPEMEYVCQYDETHFNFMSRWLEREGIYYFFEQTPQGEKVVFTDIAVSHSDLTNGGGLSYSPVSGLLPDENQPTIWNFVCRHHMVPRRIYLKDYNYEKPSLNVEGRAEVDGDGRGENYLYGEHFLSQEDGDRLAEIRSQELMCRKTRFFGDSSVPYLTPGYTFLIQDHYKNDFNRKYLLTEVVHEGQQTTFFTNGLENVVSRDEETPVYRNNFTAQYADLQFRPKRTAIKPRIPGTINARIDASSSGQYAELDDHGRYKVRLPFDLNTDHLAGKASTFVRMMQPYAGPEEGIHFPLRKGTEVLLTFLDGDPDRPVIAGAVPNPNSRSPVLQANQTSNVIKTSGQNMMILEDLDSNQCIHLQQACGNEIVLQSINKEGEIRIRSHRDNEILLRGKEDEEAITLTDHGGNRVTMQGKKDDEHIRITDRGGNEILMQGKAGGEKIEITDQSGNLIRLNGVADQEGITIQDKFGNKIVTDAVEGHMTLSSPSHNSSITLGKSIKYNTDSKSESVVSADATFTALGATSNCHAGGKFSAFAGGKVDVNVAEALSFFMGFQQNIHLLSDVRNIIIAGAQDKYHLGTSFSCQLGYNTSLMYGPTVLIQKGFRYTDFPAAVTKSADSFSDHESKINKIKKWCLFL